MVFLLFYSMDLLNFAQYANYFFSHHPSVVALQKTVSFLLHLYYYCKYYDQIIPFLVWKNSILSVRAYEQSTRTRKHPLHGQSLFTRQFCTMGHIYSLYSDPWQDQHPFKLLVIESMKELRFCKVSSNEDSQVIKTKPPNLAVCLGLD